MYEKYLAEIKQMLSCMSERDIQIVARIYDFNPRSREGSDFNFI